MVLQWVMSKERDHFTKFMALKTFFLHLNLHVIKKWYNQNHINNNMTHPKFRLSEPSMTAFLLLLTIALALARSLTPYTACRAHEFSL